VIAILVKCALNSKLITDSVTSKAPSHLLHASWWNPTFKKELAHLSYLFGWCMVTDEYKKTDTALDSFTAL
jgi:hypothetical protein